jgi:hypothetical protein
MHTRRRIWQGVTGLSLPLLSNLLPRPCHVTTVVGEPVQVSLSLVYLSLSLCLHVSLCLSVCLSVCLSLSHLSLSLSLISLAPFAPLSLSLSHSVLSQPPSLWRAGAVPFYIMVIYMCVCVHVCARARVCVHVCVCACVHVQDLRQYTAFLTTFCLQFLHSLQI